MLTGIVNLHKPTGLTSRQATDRVKRCVKPAKTGHAGTLDPLASGVLVVCVGAATRLIEYVQAMPKRYTGTFLLGRESDTEDIEGDVRMLDAPPVPSAAGLAAAVARLTGEIEQRPPAYSALKIGGRRAYDLARAGQPVELAPRRIMIHSLEVTRYDYPELVLDVRCGSGTYIRSLGRDLAHALGTGAVMSALVRTEIGAFRLEDAVLPDELNAERIAEQMLPPVAALAALPVLHVSDEELARLRRGLPISRSDASGGGEAAAVDREGRLAAIVASPVEGEWRPIRNFL
jgi:tRNA pseudouridine55 synthase